MLLIGWEYISVKMSISVLTDNSKLQSSLRRNNRKHKKDNFEIMHTL